MKISPFGNPRFNSALASMLVVPCLLSNVNVATAAEQQGPVNAPERVDALEDLVLAERYREAYEYGRHLENYWEGVEKFDFSFGLAALESGDFDRAVFSLERAQVSNPSQQRYRLELARAYFYSKNLDSSEKEFRQVLEKDPPPPVRRNIEKFLRRIDKLRNRQETTYTALLELAGGYDTNVNSGPYLGTVPGDQLVLNQTIKLDEESKEQSSGFLGVLASGAVLHPIDQRNLLDARLTGISKNNMAEEDFDLDAFFIDAGYSHRFFDVHRIRLGARYQRTYLAGDGFLKSPGASLGWNFTGESGWSIGAQALYAQYDYDTSTAANDPDVTQWLGQFLVFAPPSTTREGLVLHYGEDEASKSEFDYNSKYFYGVRFQQTYLFNIFSLGWNVAFVERRFQERRPAISRKRHDASTSLGFDWRATVYKNISIRNLYTYTYNFSNLNFYRYRRLKAELAVQMDF